MFFWDNPLQLVTVAFFKPCEDTSLKNPDVKVSCMPCARIQHPPTRLVSEIQWKTLALRTDEFAVIWNRANRIPWLTAKQFSFVCVAFNFLLFSASLEKGPVLHLGRCGGRDSQILNRLYRESPQRQATPLQPGGKSGGGVGRGWVIEAESWNWEGGFLTRKPGGNSSSLNTWYFTNICISNHRMIEVLG